MEDGNEHQTVEAEAESEIRADPAPDHLVQEGARGVRRPQGLDQERRGLLQGGVRSLTGKSRTRILILKVQGVP